MNNLLTIGISTHGRRQSWLQDTIESMLYFNDNQKFNLIIVDNASEDNTIDYLNQLKKQVDLKIISNSENLDDTIAMNQILRIISSKYFLKIDSDVIFLEHNCIEESILFLNNSRVSMVGPYWDLSLTRKEEIFDWSGYERSKKMISEATLLAQSVNSHLEVTMRLPRGNYLLMKTSDIIKVGGFDERYKHNAMEYPLTMKLLELGLDYSEFSREGIIHRPSDEQRLKMRKNVPYMF